MHLENIHSMCAEGRVNPSQENTCRGQRSPNTQAHLTPLDQGTARLIHLSETGSGKKQINHQLKGPALGQTPSCRVKHFSQPLIWVRCVSLGPLPWVISKSGWASGLNLVFGESRVSVVVHTVCWCLDAVKVRSTSTPALTVLYSSNLACRENVPLFSSSTGSVRLKTSRTLNRPAGNRSNSYLS